MGRESNVFRNLQESSAMFSFDMREMKNSRTKPRQSWRFDQIKFGGSSARIERISRSEGGIRICAKSASVGVVADDAAEARTPDGAASVFPKFDASKLKSTVSTMPS